MSKKIGLAEYNKKRSFSDTPEPKGVRPKKPTTGATLASAITAHVLYVDCGYNVMGV